MNRRCFGLTKNLNRCQRRGDWLFFCPEHRKQPIAWVTFFVFTVIAGTASIYSVLRPQPKASVTVIQPPPEIKPPENNRSKPPQLQPPPSQKSPGTTPSPTIPDQPKLFEFANRLNDVSKWESKIFGNGNSISTIDNEEGKQVRIESKIGYDAVWIESPLVTGPNVFILEAEIKAENLVPKSHEIGAKGKFQVVTIKNGIDIRWWPDKDFLETDGWEQKALPMMLGANESAVFRIGLQKTQGVVYVKNLRVKNFGIREKP